MSVESFHLNHNGRNNGWDNISRDNASLGQRLVTEAQDPQIAFRPRLPNTAEQYLTNFRIEDNNHSEVAAVTTPFERDATAVDRSFRRIFNLADSNRNGFITSDEAHRVLANRSLTGNDACVAAAMLAHFDEIKKLSSDQWGWESEISRQDVNRLMTLWRTNLQGGAMTQAERETVEGMQSRIARTREMLANSSMDLFADRTNPIGSVRPEGFIQGQTGNCNFVAAAAGMANLRPSTLHSMFTQNRDGSYTVNFHDDSCNGRRVPITVQPPTQAELAYHETGSAHGTYGMVMQMAHGRYFDRNAARGSEVEAGHGWAVHRGLRMLTGEDYSFNVCRTMSDEALYNRINENLRRRNPVNGIFTSAGDSEPTGLPSWHHYTIMRMEDDPAHPGDHTRANIVLRNPHGCSGLSQNAPADVSDLGNGLIRMSYRRFAARNNFFAYLNP